MLPSVFILYMAGTVHQPAIGNTMNRFHSTDAYEDRAAMVLGLGAGHHQCYLVGAHLYRVRYWAYALYKTLWLLQGLVYAYQKAIGM